jgi:hypothetical protein
MRLRGDRQAAISSALREKEDEVNSSYNISIFFHSLLKISRLRQQHKSELQTIINEMSSNTTETRVSDLLRKIESQDATIIHLKVTTQKHIFVLIILFHLEIN